MNTTATETTRQFNGSEIRHGLTIGRVINGTFRWVDVTFASEGEGRVFVIGYYMADDIRCRAAYDTGINCAVLVRV